MSFGLQVRAPSQISRAAVIAATSLFLLTWVGCASTPTANRPETWAQPVKLEGVPNLYRVSGELYRGDQPSAQGMQNLKNLGLKTILNLRSFHSDRGEIGDTGLAYEHIYMKAWHPEEEDVVRFLKIVTDPKRAPVLVHCQHGADRTGTMIAVYRIAVQGWSKAEAIRE
ncbi:MAG: tyrosine-protein phosphatase, partial [Deltaproteobacteria bacterium]|nr:tyrosine-protein phosphatase [Deltaproteobacteria bacterium]